MSRAHIRMLSDSQLQLIAAFLAGQLLQRLIEREAARLLSRREFLERRQVLRDNRLRRNQDKMCSTNHFT